MFCKKCGSIMLPKKENGKSILKCTSCGNIQSGEFELKEKVEKKLQKIEVVEKEVEILPVMQAHCTKCGNNEAYFWTIQTRAADEPETKFYKCRKCGHQWREYS